MANTIDILGDDAVTDSIIDGSIAELVDDQITSIGDRAFYNCSALTSIDLPAVTSISSSAFSGCSALTSIDLPAATSIGTNAFQKCTKLTRVILRNTSQVVSLSNTSAFSNANSAIIYVPDALVDNYKAATNWSTYASRIKGLSEIPA